MSVPLKWQQRSALLTGVCVLGTCCTSKDTLSCPAAVTVPSLPDHTCTSATAVKGEHSCNIDVYALALKTHHASQQYMQMKKSLGSRFVEVSGGGSGLHGARHRAVVIAQLGLDILISLNGLPDSGAEPLLSLCPAPLTINAFGSLGTMGGGPTDVKIDTAEEGKLHSVGAQDLRPSYHCA